MADGFFSLGEMIAGGGIDREGARLEGLDVGSKIQARRASTVNALAQARLRVDEEEAKLGLADTMDALGLPREMSVAVRAGVDPKQITGALLEQQEFGNRAGIADIAVPFEQRQAFAQAVEGEVVDPFQFGPGGELFTDVFTPGDAPAVTETGVAAIAADEALALKRRREGELAREKTLFPDRFKSSVTLNLGAQNQALSDILEGTETSLNLPGGGKTDLAFGVPGALGKVSNIVSDVLGGGTIFENVDQATTAIRSLRNATLNTAVLEFPGRPTNFIAQRAEQLFPTEASLFQGPENASRSIQQLRDMVAREVGAQKSILDAGLIQSKGNHDKAVSSVIQLQQLLVDYEATLNAMSGLKDTQETAIGQKIQLPGGTATRIE